MLRILLVLLAVPTLSFAEGLKEGELATGVMRMPGVEYFCTDTVGKRHEIGEVMCLNATSCQQFLAKCDMSLNNPMWRQVQEGCPTAGGSFLDRLQLFSPVPDATLVSVPVISAKT